MRPARPQELVPLRVAARVVEEGEHVVRLREQRAAHRRADHREDVTVVGTRRRLLLGEVPFLAVPGERGAVGELRGAAGLGGLGAEGRAQLTTVACSS